MSKDKLNNLLSFKEYTDLKQYDKPTKRTEIGGDVVNENIYTKIKDAQKSGKDIDKFKDVVKKKILNSCKNNQIKNVTDEDNGSVSWVLNNRYMNLTKSGIFTLYDKKYEEYRDKKGKKKHRLVSDKVEVKMNVGKDWAEEVLDAIEDCR